MVLLKTCLAVLLISCVQFIQSASGVYLGGHSIHYYNIQKLLNGDFDNYEQVQYENSHKDLLQARFVPFKSHLGDGTVLIQEYVNHKLTRLLVAKISEPRPGIISMATYNVTEAKYYDNPPRNISAAEASSIKSSEIHLYNDCYAEFQPDGENRFVGAWESCGSKVRGRHELYVISYRCDVILAFVPPYGPEKFSVLPYRLKRKSPRYPLSPPADEKSTICRSSS